MATKTATALTAPQYFQLVPPPGQGQPFFAMYQVGETDIPVYSTRNGKWASDPKLHYFDLLNPHETMNEWDVQPVKQEQVPPLFNTSAPMNIDLTQMEANQRTPHWLSQKKGNEDDR